MSLNKFVCGSFKNPAVPLTVSIPTDFYSQKLWAFIFLALDPGAGGLVWGCTVVIIVALS